MFCLFCEEHLASVPSSAENQKPESLSCDCPARQELSATRKRERRVTEGNMCGTQIQLYLVIFALTTRERGEEVGTETTAKPKQVKPSSRRCGLI